MIRTVQVGKYKLYADDGSDMPEDIRDLTGLKILQNGINFERHVYEELRRLMPDCHGFLDLGSNVGLYTIAARDLHSTVPIVAVEASFINTQLLLKSLVENGIEGVTVINHPVANYPRIINVSRENKINVTCATGLSRDTAWEYAQAFPMDFFNLPPINLIKMDIEGFEYLALLGMSRLLTKKPAIIFEYCPQMCPRSGLKNPIELLEYLISIGYKLTVLDYIPNTRKTFTDATECHNYMVSVSQWITDILAEQ